MAAEVLQESPANNTPDTNGSPWAFRHYWGVLAGLMSIQTIFAVLFLDGPSGPNEDFFIAMLGMIFSQPLLLSLWAALAPQPFYMRFLWCLPLCGLIAFCETMKMMFVHPRDGSNIFLLP